MQFRSPANIYTRIRQRWDEDPQSTLVPLILFAINAVLMHAVFFPNFSDINPWDEASYMYRGMRFIESGDLPVFSDNPLTTLIFGLTYLPFRSSPLWIVHSSSLIHFLLFALLWFAAYAVARELKAYVPVPVMMGLMFITTITARSMRFPSDPLFASFAGLSFSYLLRYHRTHQSNSLWLASLMMGLAAMARNDGIILFPILLVLALIEAIKAKEVIPALLRLLVPFLLIIGGYLGIYAMATGELTMGTSGRTYDAFEVGHLVIMEGLDEGEPVLQAADAARAVFGTPEENDNNVLTAIRRAPDVYLQRLLAAIKKTPPEFLLAYSRLAYLMPFLILRGLYELLRRRQYQLAFIFIAWPMHLVTSYITTVVRQGHLIFPYYAAFGLSAIGLWALLKNLDQRPEKWIWRLGLGAIILFAILDNHPSTGMVYTLFWIMLEVIVCLQRNQTRFDTSATLLVLLAAGLILRGSYPQPVIRSLGSEPEEQALIVAADILEPGENVASTSPGFAWALKAIYISLSSPDTPSGRSPQDFVGWLRSQNVGVVYVNSTLMEQSPGVWALLQAAPEGSLTEQYVSDDGSVRILEVAPSE